MDTPSRSADILPRMPCARTFLGSFWGRHCARVVLSECPRHLGLLSLSIISTTPKSRCGCWEKHSITLLREYTRAALPPPRSWGKIDRDVAMSWSEEAATGSSGSNQTQQRPQLLRNDSLSGDELKIEEKGIACTPAPANNIDAGTHQGRLASMFSDRMPVQGMYPSYESSFLLQELDVCAGSTVSSTPYALSSSLDIQQFDESNGMDFQQLFPPGASTGMDPPSRAFLHVSEAKCEGHVRAGSYMTHHSDDHYTGPAYQPIPLAGEQASGMMTSFPFGPSAMCFDETDDVTMHEPPSASLDEVEGLFGHASLQTPPVTTAIPRVEIVSPIHNFAGVPRGLMPPPMRRESIAEEQTTELDDVKFSQERRKLCIESGCQSQARAFNRCKRHGGSKRCSHQGCTKSVQSRGLCIRHGGGSRCQEEACTRAAQSHGRCKMHGGGRPCVREGCEKKAHLKRLCRKHGGGAKCSVPDCDKWAQRQGMCMTHSKHHQQLATPLASHASPITMQASPISRPARLFLADLHDVV